MLNHLCWSKLVLVLAPMVQYYWRCLFVGQIGPWPIGSLVLGSFLSMLPWLPIGDVVLLVVYWIFQVLRLPGLVNALWMGQSGFFGFQYWSAISSLPMLVVGLLVAGLSLDTSLNRLPWGLIVFWRFQMHIAWSPHWWLGYQVLLRLVLLCLVSCSIPAQCHQGHKLPWGRF